MLVISLDPLMADQSVPIMMSVIKAAFIMFVVEACEAEFPEPGQCQILLYGLPGCFVPLQILILYIIY